MSQTLTLRDYQSLINLQPIPVQSVDKNINYDEIIHQLVQSLNLFSSSHPPCSIQEGRAFIRRVLTMRHPQSEQPFSAQIHQLIDQMLAYERDHLKTLTNAMSLPVQFPSLPQIRVWHGDITTLTIDAIVNAANNDLLGCFEPSHLCIDNVIHAAAGPRLRDDCYQIMQTQQQFEPAGHAKITLGYNLPAKYVLHTVGPQLYPGTDATSSDDRALASCYKACLDLATEINTITSIAFCCISTGIFAFPADRAYPIAIKTVLQWLAKRGSQTKISLIVFNVFSEADEQRYLTALNHSC